MTVQIDKNVPIPPPSRGRKPTYPFGKMKIGDSFEVATKAEYMKVQKAARSYATRHGMQFATRKTSTGYRVWRVAKPKQRDTKQTKRTKQ